MRRRVFDLFSVLVVVVVCVTTTTVVTSFCPTAAVFRNGPSFVTTTKPWRLSSSSTSSSSPDDDWSDFLPQQNRKDDDDDDDIDDTVVKFDVPKLGIDLRLDPLTPQEAAELKAEVNQLVSERIAAGIDDIQKLRDNLSRELEQSQRAMQARSEFRAQQASAQLQSKIDALAEGFLSQTKAMRESTQRAAAADQAMQGRGVEVGVWGELGGAAVPMTMTTTTTGGMALLGSVAAAKQQQQQQQTASNDDPGRGSENRILVVADEAQDPLAKAVIPVFTGLMTTALPNVLVQVLKPTSTIPLGGDNAACAVLFTTSLSDRSSVNTILDRVLRKTIQGDGSIGTPPTHIVAVSTLGTTRTNKMPYSMQNMMSGGKLDQRRQMEEAVVAAVRNRAVEPPLDYTICKFGEIDNSGKKSIDLQLLPGDVLDGATSLAVASQVLVQAIAFQPAARNATLGAIGTQAPSLEDTALWDEAFLCLDGPEIFRRNGVATTNLDESFLLLEQYLQEWAQLLATSGKGLTTPIQAVVVPADASSTTTISGSAVVQQRARVQLLFLPTNTGKNYKSRDEEVAMEQKTKTTSAAASGSTSVSSSNVRRSKLAQEGGVEIVLERTTTAATTTTLVDQIRIRAKRCNYYSNDAVIKELSEETILSRLNDAISVWQRDQKATAAATTTTTTK